jgi:3-phosphoglycerate kinase
MSHIAAMRLDRIEGEASDEFTLQPVADRLSELLGVTVRLEKDWLARNKDNVSEWGDMSVRRLLFQRADTLKIHSTL